MTIKIIARPRGAGKTYATFEWLKAHEDAVLITPTHHMAAATFLQAQSLGFDLARDRFVAAQAALGDREGRDPEELRKRHYVIDNAELVLASLFGNVDVITINLKIEADS